MTAEFPTMLAMRQRVPRRVWDVLRGLSVLASVALCVALVVDPKRGLFVFWGLIIAILPLVFFLAPGLWRNICPLATVSQVPRRFSRGRSLTLPPVLQRHGYLIAVALFLGIAPARKVLFNSNGPAVAALLVGVLVAGFAAGTVFKGKSGWCSTFCPLLPVQRIYGQTPFAVVRNSHCEPCVGCTVNCYDFNPRAAQLADVHDEDVQRGDYRRLFAGAFPAFVIAFYTLPAGHGWGVAAMYGKFGLALLVGLGAYFLLDAIAPVPRATLTAVFGAIALNAYYWFNVPALAHRIAGSSPWWWAWPARLAILGLTLVWVQRSWANERRFVTALQSEPSARIGATADAALDRAAGQDSIDVTLNERTIAVAPGASLLAIAERHGVAIEAGCRMGVCGADPVCVLAGAENLSPIGGEERATLERLGLAASTRMACSARALGPVTFSTAIEKSSEDDGLAAADADHGVKRVVVIGNGIAGVTAADAIRRRLPDAEIDVVGRERHHLYNRMAITRLIYGRSAMDGLYLMPPGWYDERRLTCWLNTELDHIDRERNEVRLGTGETLTYDRLILTTGSRNFVPPIDGFGIPGTVALRTAEDAMEVRSFVQANHVRRVVVAGGGLLGLEAAYALLKLGLHVTLIVRDRLLGRQLDERGAQYLGRFLEGLGIEILEPAEVARVEGSAAVTSVRLIDGTELPCDLLVVSTGIAPNIDVAREAGLVVRRGIVVDDEMRTNDPSIFAAGDAAEHDEMVLGLWPAAVEQAKVAATNATGGHLRYDRFIPATQLKVTGVDLMSVGRFEPEAGDQVVMLEEASEGRYRKLVIAPDGSIAGAVLLGYPVEAAGIVEAAKEGRQVDGLLDDLRAGDWSTFTDAAPPASAAA